jgi:hypothetical protein
MWFPLYEARRHGRMARLESTSRWRHYAVAEWRFLLEIRGLANDTAGGPS